MDCFHCGYPLEGDCEGDVEIIFIAEYSGDPPMCPKHREQFIMCCKLNPLIGIEAVKVLSSAARKQAAIDAGLWSE